MWCDLLLKPHCNIESSEHQRDLAFFHPEESQPCSRSHSKFEHHCQLYLFASCLTSPRTMVEKTKNFNFSFSSMADNKPPAAQNSNDKQMRSELGTVIVNFELIDVDKRTNAGARATFGDGGSIRSAQPKESHSLSTFSARFVDQIALKKAPPGVKMEVSDMLGPNSVRIPTSTSRGPGLSWGAGSNRRMPPKPSHTWQTAALSSWRSAS